MSQTAPSILTTAKILHLFKQTLDTTQRFLSLRETSVYPFRLVKARSSRVGIQSCNCRSAICSISTSNSPSAGPKHKTRKMGGNFPFIFELSHCMETSDCVIIHAYSFFYSVNRIRLSILTFFSILQVSKS